MKRYGTTLAALAGPLIFVLIGAVVGFGEAQAALKTSAGTGNWGTAGTWSPSGVPAAGDDVVIANGHVVTLNVNSNNLRTVNINAGGTLRGDNTNRLLRVTGNTGGNDFTNNGTLDFGPGNLATYFLNNNNRWAGTGTWNLSVLNFSTRTLTFAAGSSMTLNMSGAAAPLPGSGGITSLSTVTWNFTGTVAQTLSADTGVIYGNVRITNTTGVTLGVALTAARILGDLTVVTGGIFNNGGFAIAGNAARAFTVADGARFNLGGTTSVMPTGFGTTTLGTTVGNMSTVSFQGSGNQVVASGPTYGHLIAAGASEKRPAAGTLNVAGDLTVNVGSTFNANSSDPTINVTGNVTINGTYTASSNAARPLTVSGNFTVGGTYTGNVAPLNVAGDFTRTGTFNSSTGLVTLNGTAATAQNFTGATTITNLRINNTGSPGGVTLNSDVTVGTLLTLTSGVVTTGANTLIASANCPGSVSRTGGHVAGFLQRRVPAGASTCVYDVGDSTTYRPISLTFPAGTTTGTLTGSVSQSGGDHGNIATSDLDAAQSVNRFWTLTNGGVVPGAGGYSATFTFVAGDVDTNAAPLTFEAQRWTGASWAAAETAGTRTATTTQATGITGFSDFAVGQRRLNNFLVSTIPATPVCNPQTFSITARNSSNQTLTNYRGLANLSTSTGHGTWSIVTANGTLTDVTPDDGLATYQFVALDLGVATLRLANTHPETLTISVNDAAAGITSTTSSYQVDNYIFAISTTEATLGTTAVTGRDHAMSAQLNCVSVDTGYAGNKNLKAWITRDTDDPGGTAPTVGAVSLPNAAPGANNLTLNFAAGVATFNLSTTDVGKYEIKLRDDSRTYSTATDIDGTSPKITTRPFALVVSGIKQGATNNPGGTATSGSKFVAAADTFEATIGAYRYNAAVDGDNDGVPDAGATLAQVSANGATPSFKWPTALSAAAPYTPATGALSALNNGSFIAGDFSGGVATKSTLTYGEVGSFTMSGSATSFLNTAGVDLTTANNRVRIYNSAGAESGVVGRFFPDHFTLTASSLTPACAGGSFTYMGQSNLGYTFGIEARNKSDVKTGNYFSPDYTTGAVTLQAENNDSGTDLVSRLPAPAASWSAGAYSFSTTTATFSRPGTPDGPFDALQIGVSVTDADGPVLAARDMNPATTGGCVPATTCTGKSIGTTKVRFGRLAIANASGSPALSLPVSIEAQYWGGKSFITNTLDGCTSISASGAGSDVAMGTYTGALAPSPNCKTAIGNGGALSSGRRSVRLSAPTGSVSGNVTLTVNLGAVASGNTCTSAGAPPAAATTANLPYLQGGSGFNQNPSARATFGVYRGSEDQIHRQENF